MKGVSSLSSVERAGLFTAARTSTGIAPILIEKDFWVCWVLRKIFDCPELREMVVFKGGTSLSKVFHLVERFSEDMDLTIDYRKFGFVGDDDPATTSKKKREKILFPKMEEVGREYVCGPFLRTLRTRFEEELGQGSDWAVWGDEKDWRKIYFAYPKAIEQPAPFIHPTIILELGMHGAVEPCAEGEVEPYLATAFPGLMKSSKSKVRVVRAERTFWDKATILHAECYRPKEKDFPLRYSRHYYDLAMMVNSELGLRAVKDVGLLEKVVKHKMMFFRSAWAQYEKASISGIRIVPDDARLREVKRDYEEQTKPLIFGSGPDFEKDIIKALSMLESQIHQAI